MPTATGAGQPNSRYTQAVERIQRLIVERRLRPGERLPPEQELAEYLHCSRTVVREAIKFLAARGVLEIQRGNGTFVREPSLALTVDEMALLVNWDETWLRELMEFRLIVEVGIAPLVIERVQEEHLQEMTSSIFRSRRMVEEGRFDIRSEDSRFHLAYLRAAGNRVVEAHGGVLRRFFATEALAPSSRTPEGALLSIEEHVLIQQSIINRDEEKLKRILRVHLGRRLEAPPADQPPRRIPGKLDE